MPTCRMCAALVRHCEITGTGLLDVIPGEHDCPWWSKRETPLLVDVLAKFVREVRQLALSEGWKAPPPWWREMDALLERYRKEVGDD